MKRRPYILLFAFLAVIITFSSCFNGVKIEPELFDNVESWKQVLAHDTSLYAVGLSLDKKSVIIYVRSLKKTGFHYVKSLKIAENSELTKVKLYSLIGGKWLLVGEKDNKSFWYLLDSSFNILDFRYFQSQIIDVLPTTRGFVVAFSVSDKDKIFKNFELFSTAVICYDLQGNMRKLLNFTDPDFDDYSKLIYVDTACTRFKFLIKSNLVDYDAEKFNYRIYHLCSWSRDDYLSFYRDRACFPCNDSLVSFNYRSNKSKFLFKSTSYLGDLPYDVRVRCNDSLIVIYGEFDDGFDSYFRFIDLKTDTTGQFKVKGNALVSDFTIIAGKVFIVGEIEKNGQYYGFITSILLRPEQWKHFLQKDLVQSKSQTKPAHKKKAQKPRYYRLLRYLTPFSRLFS